MYQESMQETRWVTFKDKDWEGEPFKSAPKPDAAQIEVGPIAAGLWNTIKAQYAVTQSNCDVEAITKIRRATIRAGLRDWKNMVGRDGQPVEFERKPGKNAVGPTEATLDAIEAKLDSYAGYSFFILIWQFNSPEDIAGN